MLRRLILCLVLAFPAFAATPAEIDALLERAARAGGTRSAIGVTPRGAPIPSLLGDGAFDYESGKKRLLIVGGPVETVVDAWEWFHSPQAERFRSQFTLSMAPTADVNGEFPPQGDAYVSEAQYLWRWIGMYAPDLVVLASPAPSLARALASSKPSNVGAVPAIDRSDAASGRALLERLDAASFSVSPARKELQARLRRSPLDIAKQLAAVYGHELPSVVYIPAVAVIGRLRLARLTGDPTTLPAIQAIVQPYVDGKPTLGDSPTSSHLPGHLVFGELALATGDETYARLAKRAADLGFDKDGRPLASMPLHNEMSDSVFMGCAILAQVGRLTGDARYYAMALRHLRFMESLDLRPDGLYRHSPLDDAAWGRGNGFPVLGLTWSLTEMNDNSPGRSEFLAAYRKLLDTLIKHQDSTGMWRQVIDHEESYRELTATSMIGYALAVGLERKWIRGKAYERALERAWYAVKTRIAPDGSLVDVCTGTGKQPNLRAYFDRTAILGRDDRGGAMALLFAVEMARREASN